MNLVFSADAWEDYLYWQDTDARTLKRIHQLIKDITRDPDRGIGKPEPLKHALHGYCLIESRASTGSFIAFRR